MEELTSDEIYNLQRQLNIAHAYLQSKVNVLTYGTHDYKLVRCQIADNEKLYRRLTNLDLNNL